MGLRMSGSLWPRTKLSRGLGAPCNSHCSAASGSCPAWKSVTSLTLSLGGALGEAPPGGGSGEDLAGSTGLGVGSGTTGGARPPGFGRHGGPRLGLNPGGAVGPDREGARGRARTTKGLRRLWWHLPLLQLVFDPVYKRLLRLEEVSLFSLGDGEYVRQRCRCRFEQFAFLFVENGRTNLTPLLQGCDVTLRCHFESGAEGLD